MEQFLCQSLAAPIPEQSRSYGNGSQAVQELETESRFLSYRSRGRGAAGTLAPGPSCPIRVRAPRPLLIFGRVEDAMMDSEFLRKKARALELLADSCFDGPTAQQLRELADEFQTKADRDD